MKFETKLEKDIYLFPKNILENVSVVWKTISIIIDWNCIAYPK